MNSKCLTPTLKKSDGKRYALIGIETTACPICGNPMLDVPTESLLRCSSNWGAAFEDNNTIESQCQRGGIVLKSVLHDKHGENICVDCAAAGKASFVCALCKQEQPNLQIKESFGDPAEHLCQTCFALASAKLWSEKQAALRHKHQFDFC